MKTENVKENIQENNLILPEELKYSKELRNKVSAILHHYEENDRIEELISALSDADKSWEKFAENNIHLVENGN